MPLLPGLRASQVMEFLLGSRVVNHYPLQDDDGICLHITRLIYKKSIFKRLKEGEIPAAMRMLAYMYGPAVVIKTQLVVPDNRHCNAVTLSELLNSDNVHF